jgi:hypothetical protein
MVVFSALRKEDCTVTVKYRVRVWQCSSHVRNDGLLIGGSPEYYECGTTPCVNGKAILDHAACGGGSLIEERGCSCGGEIQGGWLYWLQGC